MFIRGANTKTLGGRLSQGESCRRRLNINNTELKQPLSNVKEVM